MIKNVKADLYRLKHEYGVGNILAILTNRGFHSLLFYRISHALHKSHVPLIPMILTRIVQIFYAVDIDYKATVHGGIIIIHGVGLVVGQGAVVNSGCTIYHGVTLGRKGQGIEIKGNDGYPTISSNVVLGAGAKILGNVEVGERSIIGPNCVVTQSVPSDSVFKFNSTSFSITPLKLQSTL
ncbi:serine O-acetyltransferase [Mucilaginibacter agri]|uniref:Serine acetyltransferase n=1 Tax=Mucilaginibacter agri TaxID=2695265 RepID=A0A965ZM08_9SPHI|nr:serine acetyltransferase [Mucilaginibacter agri]NCD72404.1 serine acetyltransferase [Mucilaginibacter agri]